MTITAPLPRRDRARSGRDELIAMATPLPERLASGYVPRQAESRSHDVDCALDRWRQTVADGDRDKFLRRLRWDRWDLASLRRCLGPGHLRDRRVPSWAKTLRHIEEAASPRARGIARECWQESSAPIAFEHLFVPHVTVACRLLRRRCKRSRIASRAMSRSGFCDVQRGLVERLSEMAAQALADAFERHRGFAVDPISILMSEAASERDDRLYRSFVESQLEDGLAGFHREYPVAARLAATMVNSWVRNTVEVLARFVWDTPLLQRELGLDTPATIHAVRTGVSDPHSGGRSVHILTLDGGRRIVYKPRALGVDAAFLRFLDWCNENGAPLQLQTHTVIDRGEYGWAEFVAPAPCDDDGAAERVHRRAGMLLCLLYAFGASDCHFENLVAAGEHLQLIDSEALLPLTIRKWGSKEDLGDGWYEASAVLGKSVLSTGMLPRWQPTGQRSERVNVGGLGGGMPRTDLQPTWFNINTDRMARMWWRRDLPLQPNVPMLRGQPLIPGAYAEEIVDGFDQMYSFLLSHRSEILSPSGPLQSFVGQRTRLIFRATRAYALLRGRTRTVECLRDGTARSIELDRLSRVYLDTEAQPPAWRILAHERQALEQEDIPVFFADADAVNLTLPGGGSIKDFFSSSSLHTLRTRFEALGDADRTHQTSLVRAVIFSSDVPRDETDRHASRAAVASPADEATTCTRGELVGAASRIAEEIEQRAIWGKDGSVSWLGLEYSPEREQYQPAPVGHDLYSGTAGIALFLAALHHVVGNRGYKELTLRTLAPVRRRLADLVRNSSPAVRIKLGLGGLIGVGGLIYALATIGRHLSDLTLIDEAYHLTSLITPELIANDRDLDVVAGSAGAVLALLALDHVDSRRHSRATKPLEVANACARHLLANRTSVQQRPRAWSAGGCPPLTGFSHGAAGIAYALLRLYERTHKRELWDAAREGLAYERGLYAPAHKNWPDLRGNVTRFATAWCHGAPGIGLARLAALHLIDDSDTRQEIANALETTRAVGLAPVDHLCCGNAGRVEILLYAYQKLGDPALLEGARELASRMLARVEATGRLRFLPTAAGSFFVASLFQGAAGVGLSLLRLADAEGLECALLLE